MIEKAIQSISKAAPPLKHYLTSTDSLSTEVQSFYNYSFSDTHLERQERYKELIQKKLNQLFSEEEIENLQLWSDQGGIVGNTLDHLGILNHPLMVSAYMTQCFDQIVDEHAQYRDVLVLSTTAMPLNEPFHKRGFDFHDKHINLTRKKDRGKLVYGYPAIEWDLVDAADRSVEQWTEEEKELLTKMNAVIAEIDFSTCESYADQITKVNHALWPYVLPTEIRERAPRLFTVEVETFDVAYLMELFEKKESFLHDVVFNPELRVRLLEAFDGYTGAWDSATGRGTQLFWDIRNGKLNRMSIEGNRLVSSVGAYSVELEQEAIIQAVRNKELFPCMLLTYGVCVMYCGIRSLAGYGSINYVTEMKNGWIEFLQEAHSEEVSLLQQIDTTTHGAVEMNVRKEADGWKGETAFDLLYKNGNPLEYYTNIDAMEYKDLMYPLVPGMLEYYIEKHKIAPEEYVEITEEEQYHGYTFVTE